LKQTRTRFFYVSKSAIVAYVTRPDFSRNRLGHPHICIFGRTWLLRPDMPPSVRHGLMFVSARSLISLESHPSILHGRRHVRVPDLLYRSLAMQHVHCFRSFSHTCEHMFAMPLPLFLAPITPRTCLTSHVPNLVPDSAFHLLVNHFAS
jgi:hypothetical protein